MRNSIFKFAVIGAASLICCSLRADPEIKGTATELAQFIGAVPKTASLTGESEVRVPAHRAIMTLRVTTENRSLQEALRQNADFRGRVAEQLRKQGISDDRIRASKFSSTPKYGIFGDKAKSYRVENVMRITVEDEKEFRGAAGAVDLFPEVQFAGVEFEYADMESLKQKAIMQACDNANERRKLYEEKFGLKLTPTRFNEGEVAQPETTLARTGLSAEKPNDVNMAPAISSASSSGTVDNAVWSCGELVYTARVTVEYSVTQPK
jgi:uncharacterized protein YggE